MNLAEKRYWISEGQLNNLVAFSTAQDIPNASLILNVVKQNQDLWEAMICKSHKMFAIYCLDCKKEFMKPEEIEEVPTKEQADEVM